MRSAPWFKWTSAGLAVIVFAPLAASAFYADRAYREGAFNEQIYSCIESVHSDRLEGLADQALVRAIQQHNERSGGISQWHLHGAIAYVGSQIRWNKEDRFGLVLMNLKSTPLCPAR